VRDRHKHTDSHTHSERNKYTKIHTNTLRVTHAERHTETYALRDTHTRERDTHIQ